MTDAFNMYDFVGNNTLSNEYVPNVLRFLGCAPCDNDIQEFIGLCEFEDVKGSIHLNRFIATLSNWLVLGRMKPASLKELLAAFNVLDPADKGYMTTEEFLITLRKYGDRFTEVEENEMLAASADKDKIIFYEPYLYKLLPKPKLCIYTQAVDLNELK